MKYLLALFVAIAFVSCTLGPTSTQINRDRALWEDREQALNFISPPGKARVYIIRQYGFVGAFVPISFSFNFKMPENTCKSKALSYYCVDTLNLSPTGSDQALPEVLSINPSRSLRVNSFTYVDLDSGQYSLTIFNNRETLIGGKYYSKDPFVYVNEPEKQIVVTELFTGIYSFQFAAKAGQIYFFNLKYDPWKGYETSRFVPISEATGKAVVKRYRLSKSVEFVLNEN